MDKLVSFSHSIKSIDVRINKVNLLVWLLELRPSPRSEWKIFSSHQMFWLFLNKCHKKSTNFSHSKGKFLVKWSWINFWAWIHFYCERRSVYSSLYGTWLTAKMRRLSRIQQLLPWRLRWRIRRWLNQTAIQLSKRTHKQINQRSLSLASLGKSNDCYWIAWRERFVSSKDFQILSERSFCFALHNKQVNHLQVLTIFDWRWNLSYKENQSDNYRFCGHLLRSRAELVTECSSLVRKVQSIEENCFPCDSMSLTNDWEEKKLRFGD